MNPPHSEPHHHPPPPSNLISGPRFHASHLLIFTIKIFLMHHEVYLRNPPNTRKGKKKLTSERVSSGRHYRLRWSSGCSFVLLNTSFHSFIHFLSLLMFSLSLSLHFNESRNVSSPKMFFKHKKVLPPTPRLCLTALSLSFPVSPALLLFTPSLLLHPFSFCQDVNKMHNSTASLICIYFLIHLKVKSHIFYC